MFCASALAVCKSRVTKAPTTATAQKTSTRRSVALCRKMALSMRSTVETIATGLCAASYLIDAGISVGRSDLHAQFVSFILREKLVDPHDFYGVVDIGQAQVANGARHIKNEFSHSNGSGEDFWRNENFAGEQAMKKVILELALVHLANILEDGFPFWFAGFTHDKSDAAAVGPVASFAQKNPAQLRHREVVDSV